MVRLHRPTLSSLVPLYPSPPIPIATTDPRTELPCILLVLSPSARFSFRHVRPYILCLPFSPSLPPSLSRSLFQRMGFTIFFLLSCRHELSLTVTTSNAQIFSIYRINSLLIFVSPLQPLSFALAFSSWSAELNFDSECTIRNESYCAIP